MASALERAAKAIFDAVNAGCEDADLLAETWGAKRPEYLAYARAVLMAVRDEMRDERNGKVFNRASAATVDAILNEKDTTND